MTQCAGCPVSFDVTVTVQASPANTVTFVVDADPCCLLSDAKMKKAVLMDAVCQYVNANSATIQTNDLSFYNQLQETCCRCDAFAGIAFTMSTNTAVVSLAAVTSLSGTSVTVSSPYVEMNT